MKQSIKISIGDDRISVKLRFESWDKALNVTKGFRALPPDGYKMVRSVTQQRASSGRACNAEWVFIHCDRRVNPFTEQEAYDFFRQELGKTNSEL